MTTTIWPKSKTTRKPCWPPSLRAALPWRGSRPSLARLYAVLIRTRGFLGKLLSLLRSKVEHNTSALVVSMILDFFAFAVCAPYR